MARSQRDRRLQRGVNVYGKRAAPRAVSFGGQGAVWGVRRRLGGDGRERMRVRWVLRGEQRDRLPTLHLADIIEGEPWPLALADRNAASQVRQRKSGLAVAAIEGAEEREQRRVLRDRQQLAFAERPSDRGEIKRENGDLADKGFHALASRLDAANSAL